MTMRRRLTAREVTLLIILLVLLLFAAYYLLFYLPTQQELDDLQAQTVETESIIEAEQMRLARKQEMERELAEVFEKDPDPVSMAPFDNSRNVMHQLNSILSAASDYSLNFSAASPGESGDFVRRDISMNFTCLNYTAARSILQQLHDSRYRCMLDSVSVTERRTGGVTIGPSWLYDDIPEEEADGEVPEEEIEVDVTATIMFFEYVDPNAAPAADE